VPRSLSLLLHIDRGGPIKRTPRHGRRRMLGYLRDSKSIRSIRYVVGGFGLSDEHDWGLTPFSYMDPVELDREIAKWAASKPIIKRVFIFGSRARGDHRPDSDLDVAVELDSTEFEGADESGGLATWMFESPGWKQELQRLSPYAVQLERYRPGQTPTVANGLATSSILIYEKVGQDEAPPE